MRVRQRACRSHQNGESAFAVSVDFEPLVDVGVVDSSGYECPEPELRCDEIERLAQVRRIHQEGGERLAVVPVLPERALEARREHDQDVGVGEVGLPAYELRSPPRAPPSAPRVAISSGLCSRPVVVVEPGLELVDGRDQRVGLDRMEPAAEGLVRLSVFTWPSSGAYPW